MLSSVTSPQKGLVKATVVGASGFAGGELMRLLDGHPGIKVVAAGAASKAGTDIASVYPGLNLSAGQKFLSNESALEVEADLVFCSLPHGLSSKLLDGFTGAKVIDLAGDFRLGLPDAFAGGAAPEPWVYGLTEFHREEIRASSRVANPGCYPAASILALGPLLEAGLIEPEAILITAMSGVSGAGRASGEGFDFVSANENIRPYRPTGHDHIPEIEQELTALAASYATVSFVPHLAPMNRGILVTAAAKASGSDSDQDLADVLTARYRDEQFVRVLSGGDLPQTKRLSGTNFVEVAAVKEDRTGTVLAFAAIDNLGKGAAGQAVQNANLMMGLEESAGLHQRGLFS